MNISDMIPDEVIEELEDVKQSLELFESKPLSQWESEMREDAYLTLESMTKQKETIILPYMPESSGIPANHCRLMGELWVDMKYREIPLLCVNLSPISPMDEIAEVLMPIVAEYFKDRPNTAITNMDYRGNYLGVHYYDSPTS